jgi:hypothetical protein
MTDAKMMLCFPLKATSNKPLELGTDILCTKYGLQDKIHKHGGDAKC